MSEVFTITSGVLPPTTRLLAFMGSEAISRLYRFELHLLVPHEESLGLDMAAALGGRLTFTINKDDGEPRTTFQGVIASLELVHELPGDALYRAILVPALWQLTLTQHSHIFVNQKVPDILDAVLRMGGLRAGTDYELRLSGTYKPYEHVCQYKESYFDFASRWMEREGIYYFFEHGDDQEKLIVTDNKSYQEPFTGEVVRFFPVMGPDGSSPESLRSWTCRHARLPAKVHLTDYDYLAPDLDVSGEVPVASNGVGEITRFGDNFKTPGDGRRLARLRSEELLARQVIFQGVGRTYELRTGYTFELDEHPRANFNQEYLVTELLHQGNDAAAADEARRLIGVDNGDVYRVDVVAIPATVQYRPERITPSPRVDGIEMATVDGEATSDYAQIDEHGRYFLKFKFDESDLLDGKASTRVRMLQPHGGDIEGFHFPLRKSTEVLCIFLGGDPDRPMIVGVAPNANTPSPVVSGNHTMNVIQTGGRNRFEIEDTDGGQYIKLTTPTQNTMIHMGAPHNPSHVLDIETDGNCLLKVQQEWDVRITGFLDEQVTGYVKETYSNTMTTDVTGQVKEIYHAGHDTKVTGLRKIDITGDMTEHVTGTVKETYDSTLNTTVTGRVTTTHTAGQSYTISGGGITSTITGDMTTNLTGNQTLNVTGGNQTITVSGTKTETITGAKTVNALSAETSWVAGNYTIAKASASIDISASAKLTIAASAEVELKASIALSITASLSFSLKASCEIVIRALKIEQDAAVVKARTTEVSTTAAVNAIMVGAMRVAMAAAHLHM